MQDCAHAATSAAPFDSREHLFKVKWDGVRALAVVGRGPLAALGAEQGRLRRPLPEAGGLRRLPAGTVVDGELLETETWRELARVQAHDGTIGQ